MNRNEFQDEVGRYWDVAYDEGARRATHDTEDGKAANVLRNIMSHYDALAARLAEREETVRKFGTVQHKLLCRAEAAEARLAEAERLLQWVDDQGRLDARDAFDFREMHAKYKTRATDSADAVQQEDR